MAKKIADPIVVEQFPKYKIDSVDLAALTLCCLPSTFQGMKVYNTKENELIMKLSFKWAANPNILVAAKAFGLKATFQVVDLQVFVCPHTQLYLFHEYICFSNGEAMRIFKSAAWLRKVIGYKQLISFILHLECKCNLYFIYENFILKFEPTPRKLLV